LALCAQGASAGLPLLFVIFGFDAYVRHSQNSQQSAIGYASTHVARYAPAVFISSLLGFLVLAANAGVSYSPLQYYSKHGLASGVLPGQFLCISLVVGFS